MKSNNTPKQVQVDITFTPVLKRYYYNRFHVESTDVGFVVSVWYEDNLKRNSNCYSFIMEMEDWRCAEGGIKNYVQNLIRDNGYVLGTAVESSWSPMLARIENCRMMVCSRMDGRAEIYLGGFHLHGVRDQNVTKGVIEVALCSNAYCHTKLLQKIIEVMK